MKIFKRIISTLLVLLGIVYIVFMAILVISHVHHKSEVPIPSEQNENENIFLNNQNNNFSSSNLVTLSMPIFMHHHIRIYNNPKDKIGNYLSIPPDKFKAELDLIEKLGYETVTFQDIVENHLPPKPIMLTFDDGYEDFYQFAFPELQKRNMKAVIYLITSKLNTSDYMTTDQVKEMLPYHIEVGAHTVTHPNLTRLTDAELTKEIEGSKSFLENLIGKSVISFCYPGGNYNPRVRSFVEKAGFLFATTTRRGDAYFEHPFDLARDRINFDTIIEGYFQGRS